MFAKTPRHAGGLNWVRDAVLALAGPGAGRHVVRPITAGPTLGELLEPVVPDLTFPGFQDPAPSLRDALDALAAEHHVRDLRPLPWEVTR